MKAFGSRRAQRYVATGGGPITDGLIGWWEFDTGSGFTAFDSSGNDLDGTLISMTEDDWVIGRWGIGYALDFVSNDRVKVPYDSRMYSTTMSVVFWIDNDITNYASNAYIVSQYETTTNKRTWGVYARSVSDSYSIIASNTGGTAAQSHTAQSIETGWHHLVVTTADEGSTWDFYYDGAFKETLPNDLGYGDHGSFLTIGGLDQSGNTIDGRLDDVRVYGRVLNASEVTSIYNGTG